MKNINAINFLEEDKTDEKLFKYILSMLICVFIFEVYIGLKSINNLQHDIEETKLAIQQEVIEKDKVTNQKSTLIKDTNKIYELLGFSNIKKLYIENEKVYIEGNCEELNVLDDLKDIEGIKNLSISSLEKHDKGYSFKAVYEIGGSR
ncbi:hypothetical protein H9L25_01715 [Terrisporobacter mayombei]|nr:hypothetical protein [Terrisporobacter mayombei]